MEQVQRPAPDRERCIVTEDEWNEFRYTAAVSIANYYGEPCDEYDQTCPICRAWRGFEMIIGDDT